MTMASWSLRIARRLWKISFCGFASCVLMSFSRGDPGKNYQRWHKSDHRAAAYLAADGARARKISWTLCRLPVRPFVHIVRAGQPRRPDRKGPFSRRKTMRKKKVGAVAIKSFALLVVLGTAYQVIAQDATTPYPTMAPIEQYLMDRTAEIALARTAAPSSIADGAEVMALG